jgi:serine carboxypeptidase-like clade I
MRNKVVREDLHIPHNAPEWELCSDISYRRLMKGSVDIYRELKGLYKILKYSGDTDGAVPTVGTQNWIAELDWKVSEHWRPYYVNGQIGGFLEGRDDQKFIFATVHGAGHMAPQWKRAETYHLVFNFIKEQPI